MPLRVLYRTPIRASTLGSLGGRRFFSDSVLAGTAAVHCCYVFLHTPQPPSTYPAKYTTPVERRLRLLIAPWGGTVNFAWSPTQPAHPTRPAEEHPHAYHLTAFSNMRGRLEIEAVSLENLDEVGETLREHAEPPSCGAVEPSTLQPDDVHLYVCTHGARDCRCGETGAAVAHAIRVELDGRQKRDASDPSTRVKLAEIAHVGGHKYAANLLVYPHGEWLGNLKPENVPAIIDAILARPTRPLYPEEMPICPPHWRGRMGLSKDEQIMLFAQFSNETRQVS